MFVRTFESVNQKTNKGDYSLMFSSEKLTVRIVDAANEEKGKAKKK